MKRIAASLLMTFLPGVLWAAKGVFREFPLPAAGSEPASIVVGLDGEVWFTQFAANRIGRISRAGVLTEYPIPTNDSGPLGITTFSGDVWFTEFHGNKIGRITRAGVITEFVIPTPASGPFAITGQITTAALWFTEFNGNRLGRITPAGVITEFPLPRAASGPMGISGGPDGAEVWFTEFSGNRIGMMLQNGSSFREIDIPTPDSRPTDITMDNVGRLWFTEFGGNRIGRILRGDTGPVLEEFVVPTPGSGPSGIRAREDLTVWFTERLANKVARIDASGRVVEYTVPTLASQPSGIAASGWHVWFVERGAGKVARMTRDAVLAVGVGVSGDWDTEFRFANANESSDRLYVGAFPEPFNVCPGSCPAQTGLTLAGRATGSLRASPFFRGVGFVYVRGELEENPPTVTARVFHTARPNLGIEVPLIRLSTLWERNPSVLAFPSAERGPAVHSNLVLSEVGWDDDLTVLVEAFSRDGSSRGSAPFHLPAGSTRFLVDVLLQLGVSEFEGGQIRVTRIAGTGLLWGVLATLFDDGGITVSPGTNP